MVFYSREREYHNMYNKKSIKLKSGLTYKATVLEGIAQKDIPL